MPTKRVKKTSGDYTFDGVVVADFTKRSGARRLVVEDDRGLLFIFNEKQLEPADDPPPLLNRHIVEDFIRNLIIPPGTDATSIKKYKGALLRGLRGLPVTNR